jgi:glutamate synthase domain-containing protein 2
MGWCDKPFVARSIVNVSGMSYGAISKPAVQALSRGAAPAGCWMDTGEGGLSPYHLEGGCDVIMQIGTAKYGVRDADGLLSEAAARAGRPRIGARLRDQALAGRQAGQGRRAAGGKVTAEIAPSAAFRGGGLDQPEPPPRHRQCRRAARHGRGCARRPASRSASRRRIGGWQFMNDSPRRCCGAASASAPDFIAVDGGEGGSGAAPQALADHMALSIDEALPRVVDALIEAGLRERVRSLPPASW